MHNGHYAPPSSTLSRVTNPTLIDAFDRFLTSLKAAKKSPHTVAAYRRDLEAVAEPLVGPIDKTVADMGLDDVTVPALRQAFGMRAGISAAATMARTHSVWTRFYRFLRSEGLTAASPIEEIEKVKTGTARPRSIETPDLASPRCRNRDCLHVDRNSTIRAGRWSRSERLNRLDHDGAHGWEQPSDRTGCEPDKWCEQGQPGVNHSVPTHAIGVCNCCNCPKS